MSVQHMVLIAMQDYRTTITSDIVYVHVLYIVQYGI